MSARELTVLGTASQVPTRHRAHNGYFLRWDDHGFLLDPGEGTQRQLLFAGISSGAITHICLTHLHGDHCLGLPGVVQRLSVDRVAHPVRLLFPASGQHYVQRLRYAAAFHEVADVRDQPIDTEGVVALGTFGRLEARRLDHPVEAFGYRLIEPDGRRMLPELLARFGLAGPAVGELRRQGQLHWGGRTVHLKDVSVPRPGQRFAFVMDTRLCDAVFELADQADLLVIESTFLDEDESLAREYGHLTAAQAGLVAETCGVRRLVLTHFSQRYTDPARFAEQAGERFTGEIIVAEDLARVPVPKQRFDE